MSTGLLHTTTVDFLGLMGNGRTFKVPPFQRDYSWKEEFWEDLWKDIHDQTQPESRHYMGAIVVAGESDRDFLVIDGQQRLATLSILALAVIKALEHLSAQTGDDSNAERAQELRKLFIGARDPASLVERSKLSLNESDSGFYQDYLVQGREPSNPRALIASNRLLWECFEFFHRRIQNDPKYGDGQKLAELISEVVGRRLLFILITVNDEVSAYTVFETLNARGLELTVTDLLKNFLFAKMKTPDDLAFVRRAWQRIIATVGQERFGEFLRYHYLTRFGQIRAGKLFSLVRSEVSDSAAVMGLIRVLEPRAELFQALGEPHSEFWHGWDGAKRWLRVLEMFGVKQMTPLLFAAHEKLDPETFVSVLRMVVVISFRYTVIGRLNPRELETIYHQGAAAILAGRARTTRQIFAAIRRAYVPDEKFRADFASAKFSTSGRRKKLAKYVLCELESAGGTATYDAETDPGTLEHILPENPSPAYDDGFPRDLQAEYVDRLGNLALLAASANRNAGNSDYSAKLSVYRESAYGWTRSIPDYAPEEWTPALLEARQEAMAAKAVNHWRHDA